MFKEPVAVAEFARLQKLYGFNVCFETGTHIGIGSLGASQVCPVVVTAEINPAHWGQAHERFMDAGYGNIWHLPTLSLFVNGERSILSHLGSSPAVLRNSIPIVQECSSPGPFCFFLDAHWGEYWPLRDELQVIADYHMANSVIIIHDCKVPQTWEPGNAYTFDTYWGQDLDHGYVKDLLDKINPDYQIAYNRGGKTGILYALP